jgi:hypothetical protein
VDAAYRRRRAADIDVITATPREGRAVRAVRAVRVARSVRHRTPFRSSLVMLTAGLAAAGAVAAAVLVGNGHGDPARQRPSQSASPATLDAKAFLMASAKTAAAAPAPAKGTYWHLRQREYSSLAGSQEMTQKYPGSTAYDAVIAFSEDSWDSRDFSRAVIHQDFTLDFASPAAKAEWQKAKGPRYSLTPVTIDHPDFPTNFHFGDDDSLPDVTKMPSDPAVLKKMMVKAADGKSGVEDLFAVAEDAFTSPIKPAVRAGIYRVLAEQTGITATPGVRDRLGRPGVALSYESHDSWGSARHWLLIDPRTASLLASEDGPNPLGHWDNGSMVYESMGWTNKLGARKGKVVVD